MEVVRHESIGDEGLIEGLWQFYQANLGILNEDTPIMQTFERPVFEEMMRRGDVIKYIVCEGDIIIGLGVITTDLGLDPLISQAYFAKHYPGKVPYHIPVLCAASGHRSGVGIKLIQGVVSEVCENHVAIFFNSERVASSMNLGEAITRIASRVLNREVRSCTADREVCSTFWGVSNQDTEG